MIPITLRKLIFELSKLPSIGERSAHRIAHHIVSRSGEDTTSLIAALVAAKDRLGWCSVCGSLTDEEVCGVCTDPKRVSSVLCVVERPSDIFTLERSGAYRGLYHVLHGVWSPMKGIRPEDLRLNELMKRIEKPGENDPLSHPVTEIILATSMTVEGDATALFISNELDGSGIKVSRLAQGLPKGGELEYADDVTLGLSFEGRRQM